MMKKVMMALTVMVLFGVVYAFGSQAGAQMMAPGMMGPGMMGQGGYGMMGPGMMGQGSYGMMGPGMMGQGGYGMMGPGTTGQGAYGQQWNYCPYCGRPLPKGGYGYGMMRPGMMMGRGMMGPGMMGQGGYGMMGPGMMGPGQGVGPQYGTGQQKPLTEKDARGILENYLKSTRNPNLKLGKITDKGNGFEAEIVTKKEGALVDKIFVDKATGWMRSVY